MSSKGATAPVWEQKLRDEMALSVPSLNMISMHSPAALETAQFAAPKHNDYPPEDSVKSRLIGINVASVYHIQTATGTCIDTIRGLKNTQPNRDVWGPVINSAYWTAKESFSDRYNNAADEAVEFITALPPVQQSGAANFMSYSMGIVGKAVEQASSALSSAVDRRSLEDYLAENWNKLTEVDKDVKVGCRAAVDALNVML
ncbi:hypothetical protein FPCIR_1797 [Fusarium pseudocircinatum]|uniref:Uncharacterized protein n=1 Tax=Fusarium pseudocircinatum TaxID=56676 RepID=A0A8H5PSZ9_9HYPO|nr:hypothetical protein FPCIR_1797 [Fusarium pseudocircinatum]